MDFSKFKTSDWLKIGGAAAFFVFGFLSWLSVDSAFGGIDGGNVFSFFWTGTIPWLIVMATAVLTVLLVQGTISAKSQPWGLILLGANGLSALLLLIRLLFNPLKGKDIVEAAGIDVNRGFGMIVCVIAGIVVLVGAVLGFKESGGDLNDLTDINKIKAAFDQGDNGSGGTPPPPPPAGGTPPPPPPPPAG